MLRWIRVLSGSRPRAVRDTVGRNLCWSLGLLASQAAAGPVKAPPHRPDNSLRLTLTPMGTQLPWRYRIENLSDRAIAVTDSASLLWLRVTDPRTGRITRCELPRHFKGTDDVQPPVALAPGAFLDRNFDARLYCFSSVEQRHLVARSVVQAFYGETGSRRRSAMIPGATELAPGQALLPQFPDPAVSGSHLASDPVVLDEQYARWTAPPKEPSDDLGFEIVAGSDVNSAREAQVTVRVVNHSPSTQSLIFRQESIEYTLSGPTGAFDCPATVGERTSDEFTLVTLPPNRSTTLTTLLAEVCPREAMALPGLYQVEATLLPNGVPDTDHEEEWDVLVASSVALLRLHEAAPPMPRKALGRVLAPVDSDAPVVANSSSDEPLRATSFQLPPEPDTDGEPEPELEPDVDRVE